MVEPIFGSLKAIISKTVTGKLLFFQKVVRVGGTSGQIYVPDRYIGRKCIVVILNEKEENEE
jgi:putative transposon-encoded protein